VREPPVERLAPWAVKAVVPPGARIMFPVPAAPRVKVWLAVVARVPVAFRYNPPGNPAEIEAVGVPLATLAKAKVAEEVEVLPRRRSSLMVNGDNAPEFNCQ
jgi:hypothetical protein